MNYSLYRIMKKIWAKKVIYIIIAVLLAIGVYLFCQSFNRYFIEKDRFDLLVKDLTKVSAVIDTNLVSTRIPEKEAITYEDYIHLKSLYSNKASFKYSLIGKVDFLWLENKENEPKLITFNVVFTDKDEIEKVLNIKVDDGQYYAGDAVMKYLSQISRSRKQNKGTKLLSDSYFSLSADCIQLEESTLNIDGQVYQLKEIPKSAQSNRIITGSSKNFVIEQWITADNCIFIPIEEIKIKEKLWPQGSQSTQGRLSIQEKEFGNSVAFNVINYLSDKNKGVYTYNIGNEYLTAKIQLDYVTSKVKSYMIISSLQIWLISFCSSGILHIIFSKRKKDIAISIMLGSTLMRQIIEALLEITVIVLVGVMSGFIGFCFLKGSDTSIHVKTLFILIPVSIGIIVISTSLALKDVKKLNPLEILQKN